MAFFSYAQADDQHDGGQLSEFRERLSAEVEVQTGRKFPIFQDLQDVYWGQDWDRRIKDSLDAVIFLIPMLTPSFFRSEYCREEVERFLVRERKLGRTDLILPVYYVSTRNQDDPALRKADPIAAELYRRQRADWRELRFEPYASTTARRALAALGTRLATIIEEITAGPPSTTPTQTARPPTRTTVPGTTIGPAPKSEPPTHVVDAYHRGDFPTISAAIEAAHPGDRIRVWPGLYQERLVVTKPLEILGDGARGDIEVQSTEGSVLHFAANIGRVSNLTLRRLNGGSGQGFAIDITQGRLELEGCDITSQSLSCVAIRNGADPRLRGNKIRDGAQAGVIVYAGGLGTLEDNEITGNGLSGVSIETGGDPTVRRNQIRDGRSCGVNVYDDGLGTIEDNDIVGNAFSGLEIDTGGRPTVRGNRITNNRENGVFIHKNGAGTIEDNDITSNAGTGVRLDHSSDVTIRGNRITGNQSYGVHVLRGSSGRVTDNVLTGNRFGPTSADRNAPTTLADNTT